MAPRQFTALLRRNRLAIIRDEWGPALVASTMLNVFTRSKKSDKTVNPRDLMPSVAAFDSKKTTIPNVDKMMMIAKAVTNSLGGDVVNDNS